MQTRRTEADAMDLTENAVAVLKKRYLKKNEEGEAIEKPVDMFRRVARNVAEAEKLFAESKSLPDEQAAEARDAWNSRFLDLMLSRKFMPNSPTLMNAGRELQQLSACFVLPVEDSIESIYDTLKHQALIHKSGGGTGMGFSRLRPKNDLVKSTMGVSSGPVSFMSIMDASTEHIKQGGFRRGANMGILRVDHPDIEEFIACKSDNDRVNNFNISVAITDAFMGAVEADGDFELVNPRTGEATKTVRARELFGKIVAGAHKNGEPGVVFMDRINADNPTPRFPIEATNPCSEAHLPAYDSCNLGSINLERFVLSGDEARRAMWANGKGGSAQKVRHRGLDWIGLREVVKTAVRFLDDVVEVNRYPLEEIAQMSRGNRRIGLGVMGFADMLIRLGVPYDSERALELADSVMEWVDRHAWEASRELAEERGVFANWEGSTHQKRGDRVRNATVTTIAPTGTISMIAGCSGGIEPLFAVAFMRRQAGMEMPDVNPEFVRLARRGDFYSEELMERVARRGTVRGLDGVPEAVQQVFACASDLSPAHHVRMQAAFQRHTSMGISKTINMPHEATVEDVEEAYRLAYRTGCKGIAVYRDGSRDEQVLSTGGASSAGAASTEEDGNRSGGLSPERRERILRDFDAAGDTTFFETFVRLVTEGGRTIEELVPYADDRLKANLALAVEVQRELRRARQDFGSAPSVPHSLAEVRNGRPNTLTGATKKLTTGHGPMYVTMNDDEFGPRECFVILGKPGGTAAAFSDALGRMISLALTHGAPPSEVVKQLRGIQDGHPAGFGPNAVLSVPDGVAKAMAEHYLSAGAGGSDAQPALPIAGACPDCGGQLKPDSGCEVCTTGGCGYSRCS